MRRTRLLIPALAAAALLAAGPARAGGWGPYFSWSHDMPTTGVPGLVQDEILLQATKYLPPAQLSILRASMEAASLQFELDHLSFGVLYDSAPSRDQLFSFRWSAGPDFALGGKVTGTPDIVTGNSWVDQYIRDASGYVGSLLDTTGYGGTVEFAFAIAPVRSRILKWWLGPCVRFNGNYYPLDARVPTFGVLKHGGSVAIGGGLETGVNVHVSSLLSLGITGGFLWNAYGIGAAVEGPAGDLTSGSFFWGDGPMFMVQVSTLFHTGDDRGAWH